MVWILAFLFICRLQYCLSCCPDSNSEDASLPPINPFNIKFHPYIAFIVSKSSNGENPDQIRQCTGTLVDPKWIVTAAECMVSKNFTEVILGSGDWTNPSIKTGITRFIKHPDYIKQTGEHNIALVEIPPVVFYVNENNETVKHKATRANLVTANLMKRGEDVPYIMYIACGWTYECDGSLASLLQCLPAVVLRHSSCPTELEIPITMMCVVGSGIPSMGDPGMPLLWDNTMIGMSVSSRSCDKNHTEYLYITWYWRWIQETLRPKIVEH